MEASDYTLAWSVYGAGAVLLSWLCWLVLRRLKPRMLAWLLQFWLMALLFTPWYVLPDQEFLAPALMVFAMDLITVGGESAIRALIPLVMALMLGLVLALVFGMFGALLRRRRGRTARSAR